ncbi:MAG: HhH-GPD family protein [Patescibacteria group bacterium]|nr:HhH-GPD family protein [Patescibacteria group bacterium]
MGPFWELVWDFYHEHGRDLPWRHDPTPYQVVVSEVMLQQTQVSRVLERYPRWLARFGGFEALAAASVVEVLEEWQGMGYNRRALWLRRLAQMVTRDFGGELPRDPAVLMTLPGIGPNTAGSVVAFAYDAPVVFIETNIRRVFIHHYEELISSFGGSVGDLSGQRTLSVSPPEVVSDAQLRPLIEAALDREYPREWYYALMDYGADLAKRVPNPNRRSKHYAVQSKFEGSVRQLRGEVLRQLVAGSKTAEELARLGDHRLDGVLTTLTKEGFITATDGLYRLK